MLVYKQVYYFIQGQKKKIAEIRVKRDAIMLAHNAGNKSNKYNKCIIILSLFSAFFESTKAQLV